MAKVWVVEYQKRGMPHAHILLILHDDCKLKLVDDYDKIISAEIPNPSTHPKLHSIIRDRMIHTPCKHSKNGNCLRNGKCTKYFPKNFENKTKQTKDGYPLYKRRNVENGGFTCKVPSKNGIIDVDNRWVVPYNPYLCLKYNSHINVEICSTIASIKYLYKYIYKGPDKAIISIVGDNEFDEVSRFLETRCIGPAEACYRIFGFPINDSKPSVIPLTVHLPGKQDVYYDEQQYEDFDVNKVQLTQLQEYFANNQKELASPLSRRQRGKFQDGSIQPHGFNLLYQDYPQFYKWESKDKKWRRRKDVDRPYIGRMHYVNYKQRERYFLRILLLYRSGCTSFTDLRTIDGKVYDSYREACAALGLLDTDDVWFQTMREAANVITNRHQFIVFFATLLNNNEINDPNALWQEFKDELCEGIKYQVYKNANILPHEQVYTQQMYNEGLFQIEELLQETSDKEATLQSYGLPTPQDRTNRINRMEIPREIRCETAFETHVQQQYVEKQYEVMNAEQKFAFNSVINDVYKEHRKPSIKKTLNIFDNLFFLQASAGTGKTFVSKAIAAYIRSQGDICLCNATSGIAANLFEGGRTMHSRFNIPLNVQSDSNIQIKKGTAKAKLIEQAKLIIWDEAPMAHKNMLHYLDKQLRDITGNNKIFGGKILLLCGDFCQLPPVIPHGNPKSVIMGSIKQSNLFQFAKILKLTKNERIRAIIRQNKTISVEEQQQLENFDQWLKEIAQGKLDQSVSHKATHCHQIQIPNPFLLTCKSLNDLIESTYGNINQLKDNMDYYKERNIITPYNADVDAINDLCMDILQVPEHEEKIYKSYDSVGADDTKSLFSKEFLNKQNFPGLPKHCLRLKVNAPIVLLRNVDPLNGLCNGTRMIIKKLHNNIIEACKLEDSKQVYYIPKMILGPPETTIGYKFKRTQFPVQPAFAMTINKSQGQTLKYTTVYLPRPVFEHGQFYVAVSRVEHPKNLKICLELQTEVDKIYDQHITTNIVYSELIILF